MTKQILIAMFSGIILGAILHNFVYISWVKGYLALGLFDVIGQMFIELMKMIVVPVIFFSIVCGTFQLSDPQTLGRIGAKTIGLYLITTCLAITFAITFAVLFKVGQGANLTLPSTSFALKETAGFKSTLLNLIPSNPIASLAEGNVIAIIVFALLLGFSISWSGDSSQHLQKWFIDMNEAITRLVHIVLKVTPLGVFALITKLMMTIEPHQILHILGYFAVVIFVLFFHLIITNSLLLKFIAKYPPILFFKQMLSTLLFAFSTSSSNATIPLTLDTLKNKVGIHNKICGFTIPLGATIKYGWHVNHARRCNHIYCQPIQY